MEIDLNCDLGEGCGHDAELMPLITSANVSCGFHAGDAATALEALALAAQHGVQVGAHPGFPDREHFGRRELDWSDRQIYRECVYQIGALSGLAQAAGWPIRYLKPHGALYNMACRDDRHAQPVVEAARLFHLPVLGLPRSRLEAACVGQVGFIAEGFADRRYRPDGSLVPRSQPDAFVKEPQEAVRQAKWLIDQHKVRSLCVHGDNPEAVEFVRELRAALTRAGFRLAAFSAT